MSERRVFFMVRIPFFEVDEVQQLLFILHFSHISSKKGDRHFAAWVFRVLYSELIILLERTKGSHHSGFDENISVSDLEMGIIRDIVLCQAVQRGDHGDRLAV